MAGAQEFTQSLEGVEWVKIESKAKIRVKAHAKSQLLIKIGSKLTTPDKAAGLKLVGEGGTDNTEVGFYVVKEGSNLIIRNLRKSENETAEIYLPANQNISIKGDGLNDMEIEGFSGEIEASSEVTGNITLNNVSGPLTVDSNTGKVVVTFGKVNQSSPISISTSTGEIDVTLPGDTPADLTLESTMGEIYSNFDLSVPERNGLKAISTQNVGGAINNGGVKIILNSATGNIYLRKK
jgi:hypothetical protein